MKIICISGKAGHGKDTFAQMISDRLRDAGASVLITHYADLLKFILQSFFSWDGKKDEHGRMLLQQIGTETIRKQRPDYWVDFIVDILTFFPDRWDYVLIPDTRFPNEITGLRDSGFDVCHVRIVRDHFDGNLTERQKAHISETALNATVPDVIVSNNGSIKNLQNKFFVDADRKLHFQS